MAPVTAAAVTWFQDDSTHRRLFVASPRAHARVWHDTLLHLREAGLLESLLFVDLCNEWPLHWWAPFFRRQGQSDDWRDAASLAWMSEACAELKEKWLGLPVTFSLATTEGWALVDYKDWPGLDWIKDLNAFAVERVVATGRWSAICTSNFCGPQFVGMWRDVAWHQRLTGSIRKARVYFDWDVTEALFGLGRHEESYLMIRERVFHVADMAGAGYENWLAATGN